MEKMRDILKGNWIKYASQYRPYVKDLPKNICKVWLGRILNGKQNNLNVVFQDKRLQDPFIFPYMGNYWILCKILCFINRQNASFHKGLQSGLYIPIALILKYLWQICKKT